MTYHSAPIRCSIRLMLILAVALAAPARAADVTALLFQFGEARTNGELRQRGSYTAFLRIFGTEIQNAVVTPPGRPPLDMFKRGFTPGFGDNWQVSGQTQFLSEAELLESFPQGEYVIDINVGLGDEDQIRTIVSGMDPDEFIVITSPAHLDPAVNPAGLTVLWDPCTVCPGDLRAFIFDQNTGNAFDFMTLPTNAIGWIPQNAIPANTAVGVEVQNRIQNLDQLQTENGDDYQDEINFPHSNRIFFSTVVAPDSDADTVLDMVDNCPLDANASQSDVDVDEVGDACDNCPVLFNSSQSDLDDDGIGDNCDNCPKIFNVNEAPTDCNGDGDFADPGEAIGEQCDRNGNGIGDACEKVFVSLRPPPPPGGLQGLAAAATLGGGNPTFDLTVECVSTSIAELGVAVLLPLGWSAVDFAGCAQPNPNDPQKLGSCVGAPGLGATVDDSLSQTFGPGLTPTATIDADAIYIRLVGDSSGGGNLCTTANPGPLLLGTLEIAGINPGSAPVLSIEGLAELGLPVLQDPSLAAVDLQDAQFGSGSGEPTVAIDIRPALADPTQTRWQVTLDSALELESLTFAVRGVPGVSSENLKFIGCGTFIGGGQTRRDCAADQSLGPFVDPARSFTLGPDVGLPQPDTMYVSLSGSLPQGALGSTLNVRGDPVVLGIVETPNTPGIPPVLVLDGVEAVDSSPVEPLLDPDVPLSEVALGFNLEQGDDFDHDGRQDDFDNCPNFSNLDQANSGGVQTLLPDRDGNACQCGDSNGDGVVFSDDAAALRDGLSGAVDLTSVAGTCQVAAGESCSVLDMVILRRRLGAAQAPTIDTGCAAAQRQ